MNASTFGSIAAAYVNKGHFPARDVLPLIPPGAPLTADSKVDPSQTGKIPGRYAGGGKWTGLGGPWPTFGLSQDFRERAAAWETENIGIRATDFPALDIDTASAKVRDMFEVMAKRILGQAPIRERGDAPRSLLVYRLEGEQRIRKMRLKFDCDEGHTHILELLGAGQQYVVSGFHPSGAAYEWREGLDLIKTTAEGLSPITFDRAHFFMTEAHEAIKSRGWLVRNANIPDLQNGPEGEGVPVAQIEPTATKEFALRALRSFPNVEETLPERGQFLALTASFKSLLGRESDDAFPEFMEWATADGWAEPEWVRKIWESLTVVKTSEDYLFRTARTHGNWRGDAAHDFQDEKVEEAADKAQAEAKAVMTEEEQALNDVLDRVVYWTEAKQWIVKGEGTLLSESAFDRHELGLKIAPAGASGVKTASNRLHNSGRVLRVAGVTYLPAKPELTNWEQDGKAGLYYNRWHAHPHAIDDKIVSDDDIKTWLDHAKYLFPDDRERGILLDYLAFIIQKRGVKVRWAPIIIGKQGTGKDLFMKPIMDFFAHNAEELPQEALSAQFNGSLERELIVIQEINRFDKVETYEKLKTKISGTGKDMVQINRKFKDAYNIPNVMNYVFFSNHTDAIRIDQDDRRLFVLSSNVSPRDADYYKRLASFYRASGWRKVIKWLMQRDVSKFAADGRAPDTEGKQEMFESQMSFFTIWLTRQLRDGGYFQSRDLINAEAMLLHLKTDLNTDLPMKYRDELRSPMQISRALQDAGWVRVPQLRFGKGDRIRLWARSSEIASLPPAQIRARYEAELTGKAVSMSARA